MIQEMKRYVFMEKKFFDHPIYGAEKRQDKMKNFIWIIAIAAMVADVIYLSSRTECSSYSVENCPDECVVCPPCIYCSSVSWQTEDFCQKMGFNRSWYTETTWALNN